MHGALHWFIVFHISIWELVALFGVLSPPKIPPWRRDWGGHEIFGTTRNIREQQNKFQSLRCNGTEACFNERSHCGLSITCLGLIPLQPAVGAQRSIWLQTLRKAPHVHVYCDALTCVRCHTHTCTMPHPHMHDTTPTHARCHTHIFTISHPHMHDATPTYLRCHTHMYTM